MASHYWGRNVGEKEHDVVDSTSTNSVDIELVVDLSTNSPDVEEILLALEDIKAHILKGNWPIA